MGMLKKTVKTNKEVVSSLSDELGIPDEKIPILVEKMLQNNKARDTLFRALGEFFGRRDILRAFAFGAGTSLGLMGLASARTVITDKNIQITDPDTNIEWYLRTPLPFSAIVGIEDGKVKAYDWKGNLIAKGEAGVDDASVIQKVLDLLPTNGKLVIVGEFVIRNKLNFKSNIIVDASQAIMKPVNVDCFKLESKDGSQIENVTLFVGEIDGSLSERSSGISGQVKNAKIYCFGKIHDMPDDAIYLTNSENVDIFHPYAENCAINTIEIDSATVAPCKNITIYEPKIYYGKVGILVADSENGGHENITIIGGECAYNNVNGIQFKSATVGNKNCKAIGVKVHHNGEHGILIWGGITGITTVWVENCEVFNNGQSGTGYNGIHAFGAAADLRAEAIIKNNLCYDNQQTQTQEYGIYLSSGCFNCRVEGNDVRNNKVGGIYDYTGANVIKRNIGYLTENSGTATFSGDGSTTDFLIGAHGLAVTDPSKIVVKVTPISADAIAASPCVGYVDPNDNTKIRVKFASAPASGTDNVKIIWKAEVVG